MRCFTQREFWLACMALLSAHLVASITPGDLIAQSPPPSPAPCTSTPTKQTIQHPPIEPIEDVPTPMPTPVPHTSADVFLSNPGDVKINEIAWSGTPENSHNEWIELFNASSRTITITNWSLLALNGTLAFSLTGEIPSGGYFLMEWSDENTLPDVEADIIYDGDLGDDGDSLWLVDAQGRLIDTANAAGGPWPAGSPWPEACSMERKSPLAPDTPDNWASNNKIIHNGFDKSGNPINGTPRQPNSSTYTVLPGEVIINEVAWAGTQASPAGQWIELFNTKSHAIDLAGWYISAADSEPHIALEGVIPAEGYFLIERDADTPILDIPADLIASFNNGLSETGESLFLVTGTLTIDSANEDGGLWPAGTRSPVPFSMERTQPDTTDADDNWVTHDGYHRNGLDADGNPINGTPRAANSSTHPPLLLISEFLYDGTTPQTDGDEFVEVCNAQPGPITLTGLKIGDEETAGGNEGMYRLPEGIRLAPNQCLVIAKNASHFAARFGFFPDFELYINQTLYPDTAQVPELERYSDWSKGTWALADSGDEVLVLSQDDQRIDGIAYGNGNHSLAGVQPEQIHVTAPNSAQRVWPVDTQIMPADFTSATPTPGRVVALPQPPIDPSPGVCLHGGMYAYWGQLDAHSTYSDGNDPPILAFANARAAGMHFLAVTDSSNQLTAGLWDNTGIQATDLSQDGHFIALRGYEYAAVDDERITVWNTEDFISPTDPAGDTPDEFYTWLSARTQALAGFSLSTVVSHDPGVDENLCLWQVSGATQPRDQYDQLETAWAQSLGMGWHVAPFVSSTPFDTQWAADQVFERRVGLVAPALTESDLLEALRARRVFASQDANLALTLRSGDVWMGDTIPPSDDTLELTVTAIQQGEVDGPINLTLFDRALPVATDSFSHPQVEWAVTLPGQAGHFYWARATQADGDVAQTAPVWIEGTPESETVLLNEMLPAPRAVDWNNDGTGDYQDEWLELFNPADVSVGLGGWQIQEASGNTYVVPLGTVIAPGGFVVLHRNQTGLSLNNDADGITLRRLDGSISDYYAYDSGSTYDVSLCRSPDGSGQWNELCEPTPGNGNRLLTIPGPVQLTIFQAKQVPLGSRIKLRGRVTVPPGVLSSRVAYIQDTSGGIRIYLPKDHGLHLNLGDRLQIVGYTRSSHAERQIEVETRQDVSRLRSGDPPSPLPINTGLMVEPYEGSLVSLYGCVVNTSGSSFWIDDSSGWAYVYLDPDTHIPQASLVEGQPMWVTGVVSQYKQDDSPMDGYRLLPRYSFDLTTNTGNQYVFPMCLPETGQYP